MAKALWWNDWSVHHFSRLLLEINVLQKELQEIEEMHRRTRRRCRSSNFYRPAFVTLNIINSLPCKAAIHICKPHSMLITTERILEHLQERSKKISAAKSWEKNRKIALQQMPKTLPNYSDSPKSETNWARKRALLRAPNRRFPRTIASGANFFPRPSCLPASIPCRPRSPVEIPVVWLRSHPVRSSACFQSIGVPLQVVQSSPAAAPVGIVGNCAVETHLQAALPSRRGHCRVSSPSPWAGLLCSWTLQPSSEVRHHHRPWPSNFQTKIASVSLL